MVLMAVMLFVLVASYLLMLGVVKFAEGVIDKGLSAQLPAAAPADLKAKARSL
jgi:hypothetical protein